MLHTTTHIATRPSDQLHLALEKYSTERKKALEAYWSVNVSG